MALLLLVLALAVVGGFIGDLLQVAAWLVGLLAIAGAVVGLLIYLAFDRVRGKIT